MTAISDYQLVIATTGLVLGPTTDYIIRRWDGYGLPGIRTTEHMRPFDHGAFLSSEYLTPRTWSAEIAVRGDTASEAMANSDTLNQAWYFDATAVASFDTATYVVVKMPGQVARRLYGRPRRNAADLSSIVNARGEAKLEFYAADPRWYSDTLNQATFNTAVAVSGKGFNKSFDYGWGGSGTNGSLSAVNAGNFPTFPQITLTGPLTNIVLTNETTGKALTITYTLLAGETLVIDFNAKTILLNGTASRYYAKSGVWWMLQPGANSVRMTVNAGSGQGVMSWRDAWL